MSKRRIEHHGNGHADRRPDAAVERLSLGPRAHRMRELVGLYLGKSPEGVFWRLYLTETFDRYHEFRKKDTLDAKRLPDGRIVVWLTPRAAVKRVETAPVPEEFLRGDLQNHLAQVTRWAGVRRILFLEEDGGVCSLGKDCKKEETHPPQATCEAGCATEPGSPGCAAPAPDSIKVC